MPKKINKPTKIWQSSAKLNLFLHIINKRPDGYHDLETIFQLIDYCDALEFTPNTTGIISRHSQNKNIKEADDLIIKAAKLLQKQTKSTLGVSIGINKKIPIGGGLGGGSSNAATTLLALNQLWQTYLPVNTLKNLGAKLGADVPFFIGNHSAWATGVGEQLTAINLPEYWFLVIYPNINVNTQQVFSHHGLTYSQKMSQIPLFTQLETTRNDCLQASMALYPQIKKVFAWFEKLETKIPHWQSSLAQGMSLPRMSGTGASVFMGAKDKTILESALTLCPAQWQGFVAKGVNTLTTPRPN